jgi:hypothetical protein
MHTTRLTQALARKWKALLGGAALSASLLAGGCDSPSHTEQGMGIGAFFGSLLGLGVGIATHHPVEGTLVGAAGGAAVGGLAGAAEDHAEHKAAVRQAVAEQQRRALTLYDVAKLTAEGTSDAVIINQIRASGAVYSLTAEDITYLKQNRVSDAVVTEMQATAMRPAPVIYGAPPPPVGVYVEPAPVVGVRYYRRGCW